MSDKKQSTKSPENLFPIVGIGASAGGLASLKELFKEIPADIPMTFVVIQHLMPGRQSDLPEILNQAGPLEATQITDGMPVEQHRIYVGPPSNTVTIHDYKFYLQEIEDGSTNNRFTIDSFFRSLAEAQQAKAICIVLSGSGTDGTLGLKMVKEVGGITIAQSEKDAEYPDMPLSALETGMVDHVLPVEAMPNLLQNILQHPYLHTSGGDIFPEQEADDYINAIIQMLYEQTGHDFSNYKESTIQRRIERRTAIHQVLNIEAYIEILESNSAEIKALFKDLLINVTNFFRDPEAYEAIKHKALPRLLQGRDTSTSLRIWVPACSTGEEAYSITMILMETMELLNLHFGLQVFATDLDKDAIKYARRGVYPESIVADVSPERLKRFFKSGNKTYEVIKPLRDKIIFAPQNIIKDPPFSHLDMISCRNLLIYMNSTLQDKILPLFYYVLNQEGLLFLGTSETIGKHTDLFHPLDKTSRIYRRKDKIAQQHMLYPRTPFFSGSRREKGIPNMDSSEPMNYHDLAKSAILDSHSPPGVLVNANHEILYFHGDTNPFLMQPRGDAHLNVIKMARGELEYKINRGLHVASKKKTPVTFRRIEVPGDDETRLIDITVSPLGVSDESQSLFLIIFDECEKMVEEDQIAMTEEMGEEERGSMVEELQEELRNTKEELYDTIEELEISNEELQSTNEELQSANEELQSANEELETSREEVESTNEELEMVNTELEEKIEELSETNTILQNLLKDEDYGAIFLDTNIVIRRYTPLVESICNVRKSDVGRPLSDITTQLQGIDLGKEAEQVLDTLEIEEREIQLSNAKWYYMTIKPYRTDDHVIKGVVIRFKNITDFKGTLKALKQSRERYRTILNGLEVGILLLDRENGDILEWNESFAQLIQLNWDNQYNKLITDLIPEDDREELWEVLKKIPEGGEPTEQNVTFINKEKNRVEARCRFSVVPIDSSTYIQLAVHQTNE